jgi:hypothetical protein
MVCFFPSSNVHPRALGNRLSSPIDTAILYSKMSTRVRSPYPLKSSTTSVMSSDCGAPSVKSRTAP